MVAHSDLTTAFNVTHPISNIMYCYSETVWESEVVSMADFNKVKWEENKCTLSKKCKVYYTRMGWPCNNKTAHLPFHFTAMQTYSIETETSEIACTLAGEVILSLKLLERKVQAILRFCRALIYFLTSAVSSSSLLGLHELCSSCTMSEHKDKRNLNHLFA